MNILENLKKIKKNLNFNEMSSQDEFEFKLVTPQKRTLPVKFKRYETIGDLKVYAQLWLIKTLITHMSHMTCN